MPQGLDFASGAMPADSGMQQQNIAQASLYAPQNSPGQGNLAQQMGINGAPAMDGQIDLAALIRMMGQQV